MTTAATSDEKSATSRINDSNETVYVKGIVTNVSGTHLMRRISVPTLLVQVPKTVISLQGGPFQPFSVPISVRIDIADICSVACQGL